MHTFLYILCVLGACFFNVQAFWRLECDGSTVLGRLDPLMSPGKASAHVHSVKGGSGKQPINTPPE